MDLIYAPARHVAHHNGYPITGVFIAKRLALFIMYKNSLGKWRFPLVVLPHERVNIMHHNAAMVSLYNGTVYLTKK